MVEEITIGSMINGVFPPKVWKNILEKINCKSGRSFTLKQIKQKFNRLRGKHREFSLLLQHTGFGWDAETNTVTADEEVWSRYIMAHLDAAQYRRQGLEHYNLLGIIFNKSTATGVLHYSSTQDPPNSQEEHDLENEYLNGGIHVNLGEDNNDDVAPHVNERVTHSGKRACELSERKRKRETKTNYMGDAIQTWAEATKARAEVQLAKAEMYRAKRLETSSSGDTSFDYSIAKCVSALNDIGDVPDDIYVKAIAKFVDASWREMFMSMPLDRKNAWLDRLL